MANGKLGGLLKRLFKLRNLPAVVTISVAIIGGLGITPFGLKLNDSQVIMAVLALLAIDMLIERLDLLSSIENSVNEIHNLLNPQVRVKDFFKKRGNFPRMEILIEKAHQEIWISGLSLGTIATVKGYIHQKLLEGCNILILGFDPNGAECSAAAKYFNWKTPYVAIRSIEGNLIALAQQYDDTCKGKLEIRVFDGILPSGQFIIDPNTSTGSMNVQLYPFQTNIENAPLFSITKHEDSEWFGFYVNQFTKLWNASKPYIPSKIP